MEYYTQFSNFNIGPLTTEEKDWVEKEIKEYHDSEIYPAVEIEEKIEGEKGLWIVCEDNTDLDETIGFIQEFLKRWRPKDSVRLAWAFTCSKMAPDAFGGGAAFIRADDIKWLDTGEWLTEQEKNWLKSQK